MTRYVSCRNCGNPVQLVSFRVNPTDQNVIFKLFDDNASLLPHSCGKLPKDHFSVSLEKKD
jgi:hypothetical protein